MYKYWFNIPRITCIALILTLIGWLVLARSIYAQCTEASFGYSTAEMECALSSPSSRYISKPADNGSVWGKRLFVSTDVTRGNTNVHRPPPQRW